MTILFWIVLGFLLIVSIIDWKVKAVPSVLLTGMLFVTLMINYSNFMYGLFAFVLAYFLYEFDYFEGIADIKVMSIVGLMVSTLQNFMIFAGMLVIFGFAWKAIYKLRNKDAKDCPFLPVFIFCYIGLALIGGVA